MNKAINDNIYTWGCIFRVKYLWNYMVVKASLRSYIVHHDQSGLSRPYHKGKNGENDNIHNVISAT